MRLSPSLGFGGTVANEGRLCSYFIVVRFPIPNLVCMPARTDSKLLGGVFALLLGSVVSAYRFLSIIDRFLLPLHMASSLPPTPFDTLELAV